MSKKLLPAEFDEISNEIIKKHEYILAQQAVGDAYEPLEKIFKVNPELFKLVDNYVSRVCFQCSIEMEYFYERGYEDGVRHAKTIFDILNVS